MARSVLSFSRNESHAFLSPSAGRLDHFEFGSSKLNQGVFGLRALMLATAILMGATQNRSPRPFLRQLNFCAKRAAASFSGQVVGTPTAS